MRAALPKLTEKQFMGQIIELAKICGWMVYHTHDSRRSEPGFPDLLLLKRGKLVVFECKVGNGKVTEAQDRWLGMFGIVSGCIAWDVYPEDWPEIEKLLKGECENEVQT